MNKIKNVNLVLDAIVFDARLRPRCLIDIHPHAAVCLKRENFPPVIIAAEGGKPEARVSVQLGLAFGPLDGAFQALAEEPLERRGRWR